MKYKTAAYSCIIIIFIEATLALTQGHTNFPDIYVPSQNSRCDILGGMLQNFLTLVTWCLGFVHCFS